MFHVHVVVIMSVVHRRCGGWLVWAAATVLVWGGCSASPLAGLDVPAGPRRRSEPYSLSWVREARAAAPVPIQFSESSEVGARILTHVTNYGINQTRYLTKVKEPQLFQQGQSPAT